jgi:Ni,Fe-hydrogenase III small subunit
MATTKSAVKTAKTTKITTTTKATKPAKAKPAPKATKACGACGTGGGCAAKATKPAVKTVAAPAAKPVQAKETVSAERYFDMIKDRAYILAEKDGFRGQPDEYWFAAEREIGRKAESAR